VSKTPQPHALSISWAIGNRLRAFPTRAAWTWSRSTFETNTTARAVKPGTPRSKARSTSVGSVAGVMRHD
jgi:hypothetical protein